MDGERVLLINCPVNHNDYLRTEKEREIVIEIDRQTDRQTEREGWMDGWMDGWRETERESEIDR